jgi:hypothetical protein
LFVIVQAHGIHHGLRIDCGCFGSSPGHEHLIGVGTLARTCALLLGSIAGTVLQWLHLEDDPQVREIRPRQP